MKRQDKKENLNSSFFSAAIVHRGGGGGGRGGVTPNDDLYGEAPPERGSFLRLQATEKLVGNLSFRWVKGPKRPNIYILWL